MLTPVPLLVSMAAFELAAKGNRTVWKLLGFGVTTEADERRTDLSRGENSFRSTSPQSLNSNDATLASFSHLGISVSSELIHGSCWILYSRLLAAPQ